MSNLPMLHSSMAPFTFTLLQQERSNMPHPLTRYQVELRDVAMLA